MLFQRLIRLGFLIGLLLFCVSAQAEWARIKYVVDGDTVILEDRRHVRLLAINTPEVASKKRSAEPGGEAAKNWLKTRIEGRAVRLEADEQKRDKYGRWLYYLFDNENNLINEQLLANGLAVLSIHPPNMKYLDRLQGAQAKAELRRLGIWGLSEYRLVTLEQVVRDGLKGWQRVLVKPVAVKKTRKYARLVLGPRADIRIGKDNLVYFPALGSYLGCEFEVQGWASWHKARLSILIRHPSALRIKDSNQCAETL